MNSTTGNVCPCCGRHCSVENLHCERGMAHFGIEIDGKQETHHHFHGKENFDKENMTIDDKVISLLRGCGHYLHHNASGESEELLSMLSVDEKKELISILKKCLKKWNN